MRLGSHNTMTYLKPSKWYMYPFIFIAKCQSKNYKKQYELGARWFDLRLKTSVNFCDEPTIAHGLMNYKTYKGFIYDFLTFLTEKAKEKPDEKLYIRLLYEMPSKDKSKDAFVKEQNFIKKCQEYQKEFPLLHFVGGNRKYDWKSLVNLEPHPCSIDLYSSMTWKKLDDWCPWFYATFMNKKNIEKYKSINPDCFMLIDFIK